MKNSSNLKPTSLVNSRIISWSEQKKAYDNDAKDALYTMMSVVSSLTKEEVTAETVKTTSETMKTTYYNKFQNKDVIYDASIAPEGTDEQYILNDDAFYITVASKLPNVEYLEISGTKIEAGEISKISIGMNAFIHAPLWKVDEGKLKVAIPFLCAAADPITGLAEVIAGGIRYVVPVMEPVESEKALVMSSYWVGKIENYTAEINVDGNTIYLRLGHHGQPAGIVLKSGETEITDESILVYLIDDTNRVSIVTPETLLGNKATYAFYSFPYENRAVQPEENGDHRVRTVTLVIPGYGKFEVTIDATQVCDTI